MPGGETLHSVPDIGHVRCGMKVIQEFMDVVQGDGILVGVQVDTGGSGIHRCDPLPLSDDHQIVRSALPQDFQELTHEMRQTLF